MDWESGELIWSWGHGELLGPHGASWLASGNLLIFDNGLSRGWSRVIELDPRTEQIVWEYKSDFPEDFYSPSRGSCQRLANGNTLVAASTSGRAFEITPGGEIVWSWINPAREEGGQVATVVRMTRLDLDFVDRLRGGR
jgi:outer membrane protein assembly factor BamB